MGFSWLLTVPLGAQQSVDLLTPEFGRAHRQRQGVAEHGVIQKTKSLCLGSAGARRHDAADRARGKRSLLLEGFKSVVNI